MNNASFSLLPPFSNAMPGLRGAGLIRLAAAWGVLLVGVLLLSGTSRAQENDEEPSIEEEAKAGPPGILVIFGKNVGQSNVSAYSNGLVGYRTPNIDRIGEEGMVLTDYYAEESEAAGRSTFITGQSRLRLTKRGTGAGKAVPPVTIAMLLEERGYATGEFGQSVQSLKGAKNAEREGPAKEAVAAVKGFIERQTKAGKPFFCIYHARRWSRGSLREAGSAAKNEETDGMAEQDEAVGEILQQLDDLRIDENTFVLYTTEAGLSPHSLGMGAITPFRVGAQGYWEGAFRVPCLIRWPAKVKAGTVGNGIVSGLDWLPTLAAAVGDPDIAQKLLKGYSVGGSQHQEHLDGYNQLSYLTGEGREGEESTRREFFYFNGDAELVGLRYQSWKIIFSKPQPQAQAKADQGGPPAGRRDAMLFNLRSDPYERTDTTGRLYDDWMRSKRLVLARGQQVVREFLATLSTRSSNGDGVRLKAKPKGMPRGETNEKRATDPKGR